MRIEKSVDGAGIELRTRSLAEASVILTAGGVMCGLEWVNKDTAEFCFGCGEINPSEFSRVYFTDSPLPCKSLLQNFNYLRALLKNNEMRSINEMPNRKNLSR
ncbi:MAG: hypothetical protein P8Z50_04685 [candidate division WOR-3 bacterium]